MVLPVFLPPLLSSASCRTKPQKQNDTGVRGYIHIRGRGRREVPCQHPRQPLKCRAAEQPSTAERQSGGSRTSWQPSLSFLAPSLWHRTRWHILQSSSVCMRENVCVCLCQPSSFFQVFLCMQGAEWYGKFYTRARWHVFQSSLCMYERFLMHSSVCQCASKKRYASRAQNLMPASVCMRKKCVCVCVNESTL